MKLTKWNQIFKRSISALLALTMALGLVPAHALPARAEETKTAYFAGKKVSILSHSMSTYAGVSNDTAANSTIGENDVYYTAGKLGVYREDTWWQQTIDALGMELLVNNSWSGSCIFQPRKGAASVGYGDRAVNLHNDHTGEEPDIIWVYLGCNDFAYFKDSFGNASDVDYSAIIRDNGDATFTYAEPKTACEAYAIMLHKVEHRYPEAEVYCITSTARRDPDYADSYADTGQPTAYSAQLHEVARHFGFPVVDLEGCIPKEAELFDQYIGDKRAHCNPLGMDKITEAVLSVMLGTETEIRHVTSPEGIVAEQAVLLGGSYRAEAKPADGYSLVVTMDGKDVTADVCKDGTITIEEVTGDITVDATITRAPLQFRWNFDNGQLVSVGAAENAVTRLSGTVSNGILNDGRYQFSIPVVLKHDLPWVMEWQYAGDWRGVMLSSDSVSVKDMLYLSRVKGGQLCFGTWTGSQYNNYGVDISALDAQTHTYRLENRIASDGSNMVYLLVDGVERGAMNRYFIGSKDQGTTSDWVSGKDFVLSYIGIEDHALRDCMPEYLRILECNHTYENGSCTICGAVHPNLANFEGKVISILGDSASTFAGYIPAADGFNLAHRARYPDTSRIPDVTDVNQTWWMQVVAALGAKLGVNDSWAGSQVLNTRDTNSGDLGPDVAMASLTRIQNLGSNGTPDVILFYGAGNDIGRAVPLGEFKPATAPQTVDLSTKKWDTFADAYVAAILRLKHFYPDSAIVVMLYQYIPSYFTDAELDEYNSLIQSVCDHYNIPTIDLRNSGVTADMLPDNVHPNAEGMDLIARTVLDTLIADCTVTPGENVVYSISHELVNATASKHYYKGVSAGSKFSETVTGENITVTMGGIDITACCYSNGTITISEVTGDIVITARGEFNADGHLQQLPDAVCPGTNLWNALEPENIYYTANGWGNVSAGTAWSITFPVQTGDQIWATSFGKSGENGDTANGVRITWFDENGVLATVDRNTVYKEFVANGHITAPEGVLALNVTMASNNPNFEVYILNRTHTYENGSCTICGAEDPDAVTETLSLHYDDHYDVTGKVVEIIDAGKPTSYQVGYGVAENAVRDTAVVTLEGDTLVATGIGSAQVKIDGQLYEVTVEAAPISLLLLIGQSNMRGSEGNANQSIVCPDGMVYATYGDDRGADNTAMTVSNASHFAPSALTGEYSNINTAGTTDCLSGYPVYSLTEAGAGKIGPDSGFAYEWVRQTGEKVWIVNAAHGGTSINVWQPGTTEYEQCQALFTACQETLRKEIAAGHFTLSHMAYFWCQGCADRTQSAQWYVNKYLAMHEGLKTEMSFDHDSDPDTANKTFEFGGIIPVRVGSTAACYRDGVYSVSNPYAYHESFVDLRMNGPRVAQYWMINNPELTDIWGVCDIGDDWVWMPDGTNGVSAYFQAHYSGGTVDYTTQVAQKASWYTPTTPKAVHDSIHYNQIGYNEYGREAVRNALVILGEIQAPEVETTVELLSWDGYTEATGITASTKGHSGTLVVPKVYPIWKSKEVTYELSEGLSWDYYDLLAADAQTEGTLTVGGQTVHVAKAEPGVHYAEHLSELPEEICSGLNLWNVLEHDPYFYSNGTNWGIHSSGNVYSVTIPVNPGDRIFATAFGKAVENGHATSNGIRVTFFSEYGVARTLAPAECYAEFTANGGYLTAPEGTTAVNIAMWNNSDDNEIYLLDRAHDTDSGICGICGKDSHVHQWSDWVMKEIPGKGEPVTEERICSGCGETSTREVESVWQKYDLAEHYSDLPENVCAGLNLWNVLAHDKYYFASGTNWAVYSSGGVCSVTIPVNPGDRIFATACGKAVENGHATSNGIRVTFFSAYGVAKTMTPAECYAEFTANGGCLIAPENAIAINVAMWNGSEENELYILNRVHSYESTVTPPTCTEQGYTTHTCTSCGDSYVDSFVDGSWQKYDLASHMSELPERLCSGVNLWPVLNREKLYFYGGIQWGTMDDVHSVTIAVKPGDRIAATSFERGIRVTYFDDYGVLESVSSTDVKAAYAQNGFIIVPEGAVAVNIPMWDGSDSKELYLLSYSHERDNITVVPPSCTQQGYTSYSCPICAETFRKDFTGPLEHSIADGRCTLCGMESIRVGQGDIGFCQGGVDAATGTLNTTFTNNWYANIRIPEGAEQVRFLTFKTYGNWGSAFMHGSTYVRGYSNTEAGGFWVTLDIPEEADVFRYGYLYDEIAQKNGYPLFAYVEFLGRDMEPVPPSQYLERPITGCHAFEVEVNIAAAMGDPDGYVAGTDYGYIVLPTSYTSYGEPTRLIIVCHGAGASLSTYQSDAKKTTNYTFWTDLGYAVMDMYACPTELSGSDTCLHFGNPSVLECYKQGYDYVMEHFNLKQDGIYVIGSSMGGLSSFQIVQSGEFPVIAQVGYCPVIDLHKQAYNNPWTTPSYQRQRIAQYFDFEGTQPTFTNTKFPSAAEIAYFRENLDKVTGYSPILRNVVSGDPDSLFQVNPSSAVGFDEAEAALYAQLTATHPCPVMIFHNLDDSTVSYRYSQYFTEMVNRSGQEVILYTFETGGHNAWANGTNTTVQGLNGSISLKTSQYEAYLFFRQFEDHTEHCPWVDPAAAPTCTETGLTQGEHCAVCGEILTAQEELPALGHSYENGSCTLCGEADPDYHIPGDINGDGVVNNKDLTRLFRHLSGYEVEVVEAALDVTGDGSVNNKDLTRLFRYLSGYEVEIH